MIEFNNDTPTPDLPATLLKFMIGKEMKHLYKYLLDVVNHLEKDGLIDDNNKSFYRSKILGAGNEALRNLDSQFEKFSISFKEN